MPSSGAATAAAAGATASTARAATRILRIPSARPRGVLAQTSEVGFVELSLLARVASLRQRRPLVAALECVQVLDVLVEDAEDSFAALRGAVAGHDGLRRLQQRRQPR